ncbi:putative actin-binding protein Fragmin [Aspergillus violaceofuscus CBS 115571]|uniref:Putative actin-binding protein Fragmin n=1 Tax=Aspergillus violaceofuscus (strain CBS 115571) TaxID=1450538 RepID=A0A2V5HCI0_ASPV1|nr:putative actin-binding protein Fragmin [Aspergillus violaceofuscus CBS 115571]
MPPHAGLIHPHQYDLKDSNVELINSALDHQVKYNSAATEPAWRTIGTTPGLYIWRIEHFEVVAWPRDRYGEFYDGDSYIVLHSARAPQAQQTDPEEEPALLHDIFFWLGSRTSPDEAGTAAYKTVELDEYLHGAATQHREVQAHPSGEFVGLFPRMSIRRGGVQSGFRHVEDAEEKGGMMLLRVFKHAGAARPGSLIVHEVEPTWRSLDDRDVFVLDVGDKIWVWQGRSCSPMEKGKAAQVVHDLTQAKHVDVEVLSQLEARSKVVVDMLGGREVEQLSFSAPRPMAEKRKRAAAEEEEEEGEGARAGTASSPRKLFRLSDADGSLSFDLVKEGSSIDKADLDGKDIFLFDDGDRLWVWQGLEASAAERALWLRVAQSYVRWLQDSPEGSEAHLIPISKVVQGHESPAFMRAIAAAA